MDMKRLSLTRRGGKGYYYWTIAGHPGTSICHEGLLEWFDIPAGRTRVDLCITSFSFASIPYSDPREYESYSCVVWHRQIRTGLEEYYSASVVLYLNKNNEYVWFCEHPVVTEAIVEYCSQLGISYANIWAEV